MLHKSTSLLDYSREANRRITNYPSREKFWSPLTRVKHFGNPHRCNSKDSRFHKTVFFYPRSAKSPYFSLSNKLHHTLFLLFISNCQRKSNFGAEAERSYNFFAT